MRHTLRHLTGYEVKYSTDKSLKKVKKYYITIRVYKTVGKNKLYGAWSATKNVTIKK